MVTMETISITGPAGLGLILRILIAKIMCWTGERNQHPN